MSAAPGRSPSCRLATQRGWQRKSPAFRARRSTSPSRIAAVERLTILRPDDWHLHVRDGEMLKAVLPYTAKNFARAILMPNLIPPVRTMAECIAYRERVMTAVPESMKHAICAGIGLLIALIGFEWSGIVVGAPGTLVTLGHLGSPPVLLAIGTLWLSAGPPIGLWPAVYWLPGLNFIRVASRFTLLGVLCFAVLAGVGFDRFAARLTPRRRTIRLPRT